jgi:histidine triad (HIT) family protein
MSYDPGNIFARILRGEIPSVKIHEDEKTLAFMDVMPQADGHTLVIPKENAATLLDLSPQGAAHLMQVTQRVARAVKAGMNADGITLMQFNGAAAGQTVPHIHFHVIPRWEGVALSRHSGTMEAPEKLKAAAERIRAALG